MRIVSWNINGLNAAFTNGMLDHILGMEPDIICFQEIRANNMHFLNYPPDGYRLYINSAKRAGYGGTLVYTKLRPYGVRTKLFNYNDDEGRAQFLPFDLFILCNVYAPHVGTDYSKINKKRYFMKSLQQTMLHLTESNRPVIFCGDFNIANICQYRAYPGRKIPGFTSDEHEIFQDFLSKALYVCSPQVDQGDTVSVSRMLDHFIVCEKLLPYIKSVKMDMSLLNTAHSPLVMEINF